MTELADNHKFALECIKTTSSRKEAAKKYGCTESGFRRVINTIRQRGVEVPREDGATKRQLGLREGYTMGKITTHIQYKEDDGTIKNEWIRQFPHEQEIEAFVKRLEQRVAGKGALIKQPVFKDTDVSLFIPMGDPHFGMYAWAKETGEDYDVERADAIHTAALSKIITSRERFDKIYIISLGDLLHADNRLQITEKSGHKLDVDGRYWRVIDATTDCIRRSIELAATRAKEVNVILLDGNHDPHSSGHVARTLSAYYNKSKHIKIDVGVTKHRYIRYGNNLIGLTHGDTIKSIPSLAGLMACDMREDWGQTENHYYWMGHIHTQKVFELPSCVAETFNSMTSRDAYATEYGYRSRRQMTGVEIDKQHGEIGRIMVRPEHFK